MAEVKLNKLRSEILAAASANAGAVEDKWTHERAGEIALRYLVKQGCLERQLADAAKGFRYRIYITERGRNLLAGDYIEEVAALDAAT